MSDTARLCPQPEELARIASGEGTDEELAHLEGCASCAAEVEDASSLRELAAELPWTPLAPDRVERLRGAVLAEACPRPVEAPSRWPLRVAIGIAACLALALSASLLSRPTPPDVTTIATAVEPLPGARFSRASALPDEIVRLTEGTITVAVAPLRSGERFRVITGDAEIEVHGTAFDVTVRGDRLVDVRVLHGRVEVRASGRETKRLQAGERWRAEAGAMEAAAAAATAAAAAPATASAPAAATAAASATASATAAASATASATAAAFEPGKAARREAARVEAELREAEARAAARAAPRVVALVTPAEVPAPVVEEPAAAPAPVVEEPAKVPAPVAGPAELAFDRAWGELRAGRFAAAAAGFDHAAIEARDGPLAEDAAWWRTVCLARADRTARAIASATRFLDRFPASPRAGEAHVLLGRLLLDQHDDEAARVHLEAALQDPRAAVRDSARSALDRLSAAPSNRSNE